MTLTALRKPLVGALITDTVCVLVFAAVGRHNHHENWGIVGTVSTAAPFLVGAACGWMCAWWRDQKNLTFTGRALLPTGIFVWVGTVVVGMLLRWATHQAVAVSFVIVTSIVTGTLLLGWRGAARFIIRDRSAA